MSARGRLTDTPPGLVTLVFRRIPGTGPPSRTGDNTPRFADHPAEHLQSRAVFVLGNVLTDILLVRALQVPARVTRLAEQTGWPTRRRTTPPPP